MQRSGVGCFVIISTTTTTTTNQIAITSPTLHVTHALEPPLKYTQTALSWPQNNATGPPTIQNQNMKPLPKIKFSSLRAQVAAVTSGLDFIHLARA
jgi:hypothetical protein